VWSAQTLHYRLHSPHAQPPRAEEEGCGGTSGVQLVTGYVSLERRINAGTKCSGREARAIVAACVANSPESSFVLRELGMFLLKAPSLSPSVPLVRRQGVESLEINNWSKLLAPRYDGGDRVLR
jgi:hypothetical protein